MAKKKKADIIPIVVVPAPIVQMPLIQPDKLTKPEPKRESRLQGRLGKIEKKTTPKPPQPSTAKSTPTPSVPSNGKVIRTINPKPKKTFKNIWAPKRTVNVSVSVVSKETDRDDIQDEISTLLEQRQREQENKNGNSTTEEGEINSNEEAEEGSKTPGTESEDDDLDLSTLVKLQQTTATFKQPGAAPVTPPEPELGLEEPDFELGEEEEEDSESTLDLMNSPLDPIASMSHNLPFITDFIPDYVPEVIDDAAPLDVQRSYLEMKIKHQEQLLNCLESSPISTPSDGPNTPDSELEEENELNHTITRQSPIELDEVNWEMINSHYFRPIRGRNQFFRERPVDTSPLRSPFLLRTPPSGEDDDEAGRHMEQLSQKIFNHLCDEIIIETTFFNIAEILEKKIETKNMVSNPNLITTLLINHNKDMIISDFFFTLIRDLIRGIVEEVIHHERITLELTQTILNEQITSLLTQCCSLVLIRDQLERDSFYSVLDAVVKGNLDLNNRF